MGNCFLLLLAYILWSSMYALVNISILPSCLLLAEHLLASAENSPHNPILLPLQENTFPSRFLPESAICRRSTDSRTLVPDFESPLPTNDFFCISNGLSCASLAKTCLVANFRFFHNPTQRLVPDARSPNR